MRKTVLDPVFKDTDEYENSDSFGFKKDNEISNNNTNLEVSINEPESHTRSGRVIRRPIKFKDYIVD